MDLNSDFSIQEAMRLAGTPAGKQLIRLLQQQSDADWNQAMASAAAGDYQTAKASLSSLLNTPEVQQLLKQMGGGHG